MRFMDGFNDVPEALPGVWAQLGGQLNSRLVTPDQEEQEQEEENQTPVWESLSLEEVASIVEELSHEHQYINARVSLVDSLVQLDVTEEKILPCIRGIQVCLGTNLSTLTTEEFVNLAFSVAEEEKEKGLNLTAYCNTGELIISYEEQCPTSIKYDQL